MLLGPKAEENGRSLPWFACSGLRARSPALHLFDRAPDQCRVLAGGLVEPNDHGSAAKCWYTKPSVPVPMAPTVISGSVILFQPPDPVILVCGVAALIEMVRLR